MNTEIAVERRSLVYRPMGIALAIGGIVVLWSLMRGNPATLALLAVAALFLLGLKRPLWVMAALLVSQLTVSSYMVSTPFGDISLRLLLLILAFLVMAREFAQRRVDLGPKTRRLFIPMLILTAVSTVANLFNSGFDFAFKDFRNMIVGLLIVVLLPAVTRNLRELKILCGVVLVVTVASAAIGLMQHYQFLGMDQATLRPGFLTAAKDPRVPGIGETELELAYILSVTSLAVISVYLAKGVSSDNRKSLFLSILLMAPALYFTYTRSALYALGLGIVALVLFMKTRIRGEIILAVLLLTIGIIEATGVLSGLQLGGRSESSQESSAISRPILWQAGIAIALDNPVLGIGGDQFLNVSPRYAGAVDPSLLEWEEDRYWGYRTLGSQQPHNDFLNMWISYGTLALVSYVWMYFVILRNFLDSYQISKRRFIKGLSVGLAAALVAYGANAFYHNMFITLPLFWILAGFSLATSKMVAQEKRYVVYDLSPQQRS